MSSPFRDEQAAQIELLSLENEDLKQQNAALTTKVATLRRERPNRLRAFFRSKPNLGDAIGLAVISTLVGIFVTWVGFEIAITNPWDHMRKQRFADCLEIKKVDECQVEDRILFKNGSRNVDELLEKRKQLDTCLQTHSMPACVRLVD